MYGAQPARLALPPRQQQQRVSIQQQQQPTLRPAQPQPPAQQGQQAAQLEEFSFHPALPPQHTHTPQQWRPLAGRKVPVEEASRPNGDAGVGPDATPASEPSGVLPAGRRRAAFVVADSQTPEWQPAATAGAAAAAAAAGRRKAAFVIDDSQTPVDLAGARRQPAVPVADSDASPASLPQPQQHGGGGNLRRLQRGGAGAAAAAAGGRGAGAGQPGPRAAAVVAAGGDDARAAQRRRQEQLLGAQERKQRRAEARKRAASFLDVEAGLSGDDDSGAAGLSSVLPNASLKTVAPMSWIFQNHFNCIIAAYCCQGARVAVFLPRPQVTRWRRMTASWLSSLMMPPPPPAPSRPAPTAGEGPLPGTLCCCTPVMGVPVVHLFCSRMCSCGQNNAQVRAQLQGAWVKSVPFTQPCSVPACPCSAYRRPLPGGASPSPMAAFRLMQQRRAQREQQVGWGHVGLQFG